RRILPPRAPGRARPRPQSLHALLPPRLGDRQRGAACRARSDPRVGRGQRPGDRPAPPLRGPGRHRAGGPGGPPGPRPRRLEHGGPRHGPPNPPTLGAPRRSRGAPRWRSPRSNGGYSDTSLATPPSLRLAPRLPRLSRSLPPRGRLLLRLVPRLSLRLGLV